jgi:hypothetical protein
VPVIPASYYEIVEVQASILYPGCIVTLVGDGPKGSIMDNTN